MNCTRVYDLADCSEFRQTVLAQPPRFIRATVIVLMSLIATAVLWAAWTTADLVVRASGRIRPMTASANLPDAAAEESQISPLRGGRITDIYVREGEPVEAGTILLKLNTEPIEIELRKQGQVIHTAQAELTRLDERESFIKLRYETALAKADAELAQVEIEIKTALLRQEAEILAARVRLNAAKETLERIQKLFSKRAASLSEVTKAEAEMTEAKLRLQQAELTVPVERLAVLKHAKALVIKDHNVECTDLNGQRRQKQSELETANLELADLEWELAQSAVRAPGNGTVTTLNVSVGDVVEAGQPLIVVVDECGLRMDVDVVNEDVGQLVEGLPVRIKLDAFDYQKYGCLEGRVVFISPDSQIDSESDEPKPPAYLVKIALEDDVLFRGDHHGLVKLGMTGTAEIVVEQDSLLSMLFRSIRQSISLG